MRRLAVAGLVLAAGVALWLLAQRPDAPHRWSVLLIVAEPPAGAYLDPQGPAARTPRLDRLAGAGVRLPLRGPERTAEEWLAAVLGGDPPQRSVRRALADRGWVTVGVAPGPMAGPFDRVDAAPGTTEAVDLVLAAVANLIPSRGQRALVAVVLQPADPAELERAAGRLIDGVAPWLRPSETLVVVVDRGMRSAVFVAPTRPEALTVRGALGPEALGEEIAAWLRVPLE